MILGIDEVGRGPWAGPLVIGAVVLGSASIDGLTDSKKLTKKRRDELDIIIREQADGYGLGWVSAIEIDEIGLSAALVLATKRAVEQVTVPYHEIIIDGTINFLKDTSKGNYVTTLKKADLLIPSVSAASIIAKVARDNYMTEQASIYPEYKFGAHVGYGTAAHRAAIEQYGVTPLHRLSFAPLAKYRTRSGSLSGNRKQPQRRRIFTRVASLLPAELAGAQASSSIQEPSRAKTGSFQNVSSLPERLPLTPVTTKQIGDAAEDEAANYLVRLGHAIIDRNWKTKFCEIDIISHHDDTIYFTEVKYRKTDKQGGGLAAITTKKQQQMKFAAEYYALKNQLKDSDLRLAAIDVTGASPTVQEFIKLG